MYACIHSAGIASAGIAREFSPQVEVVDDATVVMDVSGMDRLMGRPQQIADAIALRAGPRANVALAPNAAAAVHAARGYTGRTVIPSGEEAARLGGLPVSLLDTTDEVRDVLAGWGIVTFRQLAALPEEGVAERLGSEGVRIRKLALGEASVPLQPDVAPPVFADSIELEHPVELLEPLAFLIARLVNQLCEKLQSYGLSALELRLTLGLEPVGAPPHCRTIRLPVPMRNPVTFLKLFQLDLATHPPKAPVMSVHLHMEPATPRSVQEGLFLPPSPEPEKLELTLQRIAALVGKENVGSPALIDTHRPGAFAVAPALDDSGLVLSAPPAAIGFRAFRPPAPARVALSGGSGGPQTVWAQVRSRTIQGRVVTVAGPWRTSGDWWTGTPWARDDWDLSLTDGALYRVFREVFSGSWFVDGEYD